jgi:uncharacterized membrane protein
MKANRDLMTLARQQLKGLWGLGVGVTVITFAISIGLNSIPKVGPIIDFIITGPFIMGIAMFYLALVQKQSAPRVARIFDGFNYFGTGFVAFLLITIFTLLWTLLLIVPGIIAGLSYSMTYFILAEDPQTRALEAIRKSKAMMKGYRWKLFCLVLRFIGWWILGILSLGIGFLWICPYFSTSLANFYLDVKGTTEQPEVATLSVIS